MNDKEKVEFLMSQLHLAADLKIKLDTSRCGGYGSDEPYDAIKKSYIKALEVLSGER